MDALDGSPAESDPSLHEKVLQRIHQNQPEIVRIQPSWIFKLAACIAILIGF